jgi:hypothetical protein
MADTWPIEFRLFEWAVVRVKTHYIKTPGLTMNTNSGGDEKRVSFLACDGGDRETSEVLSVLEALDRLRCTVRTPGSGFAVSGPLEVSIVPMSLGDRPGAALDSEDSDSDEDPSEFGEDSGAASPGCLITLFLRDPLAALAPMSPAEASPSEPSRSEWPGELLFVLFDDEAGEVRFLPSNRRGQALLRDPGVERDLELRAIWRIERLEDRGAHEIGSVARAWIGPQGLIVERKDGSLVSVEAERSLGSALIVRDARSFRLLDAVVVDTGSPSTLSELRGLAAARGAEGSVDLRVEVARMDYRAVLDGPRSVAEVLEASGHAALIDVEPDADPRFQRIGVALLGSDSQFRSECGCEIGGTRRWVASWIELLPNRSGVREHFIGVEDLSIRERESLGAPERLRGGLVVGASTTLRIDRSDFVAAAIQIVSIVPVDAFDRLAEKDYAIARLRAGIGLRCEPSSRDTLRQIRRRIDPMRRVSESSGSSPGEDADRDWHSRRGLPVPDEVFVELSRQSAPELSRLSEPEPRSLGGASGALRVWSVADGSIRVEVELIRDGSVRLRLKLDRSVVEDAGLGCAAPGTDLVAGMVEYRLRERPGHSLARGFAVILWENAEKERAVCELEFEPNAARGYDWDEAPEVEVFAIGDIGERISTELDERSDEIRAAVERVGRGRAEHREASLRILRGLDSKIRDKEGGAAVLDFGNWKDWVVAIYLQMQGASKFVPRGTGFILRPGIVVTCRHCVVPTNESPGEIRISWVRATPGCEGVLATVAWNPGYEDWPDYDLAVLEFEVADWKKPGWPAFPTRGQLNDRLASSKSPPRARDRWMTGGFPVIDAIAPLDKDFDFEGKFGQAGSAAREYQLVPDPISIAKKGFRGLSGAPVLVHDRIVAIVRRLPGDEKIEDFIFATPIGALIPDPEVRAEFFAHTGLKDPDATNGDLALGYRAEVLAAIESRLRETPDGCETVARELKLPSDSAFAVASALVETPALDAAAAIANSIEDRLGHADRRSAEILDGVFCHVLPYVFDQERLEDFRRELETEKDFYDLPVHRFSIAEVVIAQASGRPARYRDETSAKFGPMGEGAWPESLFAGLDPDDVHFVDDFYLHAGRELGLADPTDRRSAVAGRDWEDFKKDVARRIQDSRNRTRVPRYVLFDPESVWSSAAGIVRGSLRALRFFRRPGRSVTDDESSLHDFIDSVVKLRKPGRP